MSDTLYFADTYAFFEILRGNQSYKRFENTTLSTTIFNLVELSYGLKKEMPREKANKIIDDYYALLVDVDLSDIKEAADLKIKYKKLSLTDAVGYIVAKRNNAKFLTGDKAFENMSNVEFVR